REVKPDTHRNPIRLDAGEAGMELPDDARREDRRSGDHGMLHPICFRAAAVDRRGAVSKRVPPAEIEELMPVGGEYLPYTRERVVDAANSLVLSRRLHGGRCEVIESRRRAAQALRKRPQRGCQLYSGRVQLPGRNDVVRKRLLGERVHQDSELAVGEEALGEVPRALESRGDRANVGFAVSLAECLVVEEKECPVMPDRATDRAAKLV